MSNQEKGKKLTSLTFIGDEYSIPPSKFSEQMVTALSSDDFSDVTFRMEDKVCVSAHKVRK